MIPLFSEEQFKNATSKNFLPLECKQCQTTFYRTKKKVYDFRNPNEHVTGDFCSNKCSQQSRQINTKINIVINCSYCKTELIRVKKEGQLNYYCSVECNTKHTCKSEIKECNYCKKEILCDVKRLKKNKTGIFYCNQECSTKHTSKKVTCICQNKKCKKEFIKGFREYNLTSNHFCSQGCARKSSLTTSISKLEKWLKPKLVKEYSNLTFHFNIKDLNGFHGLELDIYIPDLKIAFELNGPTHYEPIFGEELLNKRVINDKEKIKHCVNQNINLHIIDVTKLHVNTQNNLKPYFIFICDTIDYYIRNKV